MRRNNSNESLNSATSSRRGKKPFYLRTKFLFLFMSLVNLLNFVDRGVIPGATNEINSFIERDLDTNTPDVYLGLLQSSFIIGYMIGSIIFGHLIHHYGRFFLTAIGCTIWILAVFLSGMAGFANSYIFLLFARILSGFGEAGLQCTIPPWIQNASPPKERGTWLAVFYTAIPVGTALGYAYSSLMAEAIGWEWAFFGEGLLMIPLVVFMFFISPHFPSDTVPPSQEGGNAGQGAIAADGDHKSLIPGSVTTSDNTALLGPSSNDPNNTGELEGIVGTPGHHQIKHPSMAIEFKNVMNKTLFLCYTAAYAAQAGALIGVSTFGSAFLMGLGFFDKESEASTVFGALISVAGIIATPVGGILLDKVLAKKVDLPGASRNNSTGGGENDAMIAEIEREDMERAEQARLDPLLDNGEGQDGDREGLQTGNTAWEDEDDFGDREDHPVIIHEHLSRLSLLVGYATLGGVLFLSLVYFIENITLYLICITIGSGFIFLCNSAINMGVMLSVPVRHRSFAIALNVVFLHAFGDVPSPVLVGLLKDSLAPGCNSADDDGATDDGNIAASDSCRHDAHGLRVTMLITTLWLTWTAIFFFFAYFLNKIHYLQLPDCCCVCCDDGSEDLDNDDNYDMRGVDRERHGYSNNIRGKEKYIGPSLNDTPSRGTGGGSSNGGRGNSSTGGGTSSVSNPMVTDTATVTSPTTITRAISPPITNNTVTKSSGDIVNEIWSNEQSLDRERQLSSDRVRILSADEYKIADAEEQRRSVERFKRLSRENRENERQSSTSSRLSNTSNTNKRRSKSSTSLSPSTSNEPLYNRFREIEDTINI